MTAIVTRSRIDALAAKVLGVSLVPTTSLFNERLVVRCSPRLESLVERELTALGVKIPGSDTIARPGAVEILTPPGSYQTVCLLSRLSDRVHLCLGNGTDGARSPIDVYNYAMSLPWSKYIHCIAGMDLPNIKVKAQDSQLSGTTSDVTDRIIAALRVHVKAALEKSGDHPRKAREREEELKHPLKCPSIHLDIIRNNCQMMLDCSGLIAMRNWKCQEDKERVISYSSFDPIAKKTESASCSSARLLDSQSAAVVLKSPFLKALSATPTGQNLVLWDPFCGSGSLLFEAVGIVLGLTPAKPRRFPFMNFPSFDLFQYHQFLSNRRSQPHPFWESLKIFGSDGFFPNQRSPNISLFHKNLENFSELVRQNHEPNTSNKMQQFLKDNLSVSPGILPDYLGANSRTTGQLHRIYKDFGKLITSRNDWKGVFVAAVADSHFKSHSNINWTHQAVIWPSNSIGGGGPAIDLLEWNPN